jgi:hypothetical protein
MCDTSGLLLAPPYCGQPGDTKHKRVYALLGRALHLDMTTKRVTYNFEATPFASAQSDACSGL